MSSREMSHGRGRSTGSKTFAKVAWRMTDLLSCFDVTPKEAADFLARHESEIQERTIERGWEVLDTLGRMDGLKPRDSQDPEAEDET